jgi:hypothetical protein
MALRSWSRTTHSSSMKEPAMSSLKPRESTTSRESATHLLMTLIRLTALRR